MHDAPGPFIPMLLEAYASGAFPMADAETGEIQLYTADPRALLPLDDRFHAPRSVTRDIKRGRFLFRTDTAFTEVAQGCAEHRRNAEPGDAWLSPELIELVTMLHDAGYAHSLEAWSRGGTLVGGIYGVSIGTAFLGESMFHRVVPRQPDGTRHPDDGTGASAACLVRLWQHLVDCGYTIFDAQIPNTHTQRFGLVSVPLAEYQRDLAQAAHEPDAWRPLVQA